MTLCTLRFYPFRRPDSRPAITAQQFKRFIAVGIVTFLLLLLYATEAAADSLTGKVVKITDGDTLTVLDANYKEHKIRLAGIDVSERKQARRETKALARGDGSRTGERRELISGSWRGFAARAST